MARLFTSGFELQSITNGVEFDTAVTPASLSISTAIKRTGAASLRVNPAATTGYFTQTYCATGNTNTRYMRVYLYIATAPAGNSKAIVLFRDNLNGNGPILQLNNNRTLILFDAQNAAVIGSPSSALTLSTWYRLEVTYNYGTGATTAYLDGSSFASGTTIASLDMNVVRVGMIDTETCDLYYDDIAINDSSGSFQNTLPGAGGVFSLRPNNSGDFNTFATQTGGTAGAANNYTRLSEVTPDDATTFNGSSTLNEHDLVNFDPSGIGASDLINVVEVHARFRNSTADTTAGIKFEIEKTGSGTVLQSAELKPNSVTWRTNSISTAAFRVPPLVTYQNPDAAAWTQATLDTLQAGYKLTTAPGTAGRRIDVSCLPVMVDYTPSTGQTISPSAIASTAALGSPTLSPGGVSISPAAIGSTAALGVAALASVYTVSVTAIASSATIGTPTLSPGTVILSPTAVASTSSLGVPALTPGAVSITPTGIANTVTLGSPTVSGIGSSQTISPTAVAATSAIGSPTLTPGAVSVTPSAIASTATLGVSALSPGSVTISPTGIGSLASLGAVSVNSAYTILPTGISTTVSVGSPTLSPGSVTILSTGIASTAALGSPTLIRGTVGVSPSSITSTLATGTVTLSSALSFSVSGISSVAAVGSPTVAIGPSTILPNGITSTAAIGTPTVVRGPVTILPGSIPSSAAIGTSYVVNAWPTGGGSNGVVWIPEADLAHSISPGAGSDSVTWIPRS